MKNILAVVVTYRKPESAANICFDLLKQSNINIRIIVIDNSMNEECNKFLRQLICSNDIYIYTSTSNLGYAKGNNLGVNLGTKIWGDFDYILFSNDDIVISDDNILSSLIYTFDCFYNVGCLQPKIVLKNGYIQGPYNKSNIYIESFKFLVPIYWLFVRKFRQYQLKKIKSIVKCYRVMGAFFIIDFKIFNKVNGFDDNTFLFREEEILSIKLISNGYISYYNPKYSVTHLQEKKLPDINTVVDHSDLYFYSCILKKSKISLLIFNFSKFIYRKIYFPLLRFININ